jgi:HemY protein
MLKALVYLLLVAAAALGLAWFADRPGTLNMQWLGYEIETSVFVAVVAIIGIVALLLLVIGFVTWLVGSPKRMARYMRERRRVRGLDALRRGMFAVGAGDEATAARYAGEARRNLPNEPLTKLLRAQSAQLSGDRGTARRIFESLADEEATQLLGLRGLFLEARHEKHEVAAKQFAERAVSLNPQLPWAVHALFDMQCRSRDWQGALETLAVARTYKHLDRKMLDRRRAVLLTAQAMEMQETQATRALELASEAHRLAPNLVPAANIAGRLLASQGATYKAARVIARSWQVIPHPDLATAYAFARPGDSPRDRLARMKTLAQLTPNHPEARVALATAACDAHEWEEARAALHPLLASNPSARACALMARIEGSQKRDAGRVREWLARAVRAPRDPVWMADGVIASEWAPISPVTGTLDAFEWRTPPDSSKGIGADALLEDVAALGRELEARAIPEVTVIAEPRAPTVTARAETAVVVPAPSPAPVAKVVTPPSPPATVTVAPVAPIPVPPPPARPPVVAEVPRSEPAQVVAAKPQPAPAAVAPAPVAKESATLIAPTRQPLPPAPAAKRAEPKIFVPDRPPDDPGPQSGETEEEEGHGPLARFRNTLKQQTT